MWLIEFVRVTIWPVLIFVSGYYFRKNISNLLDGIYNFKFPGGEVAIQQKEKQTNTIEEENKQVSESIDKSAIENSELQKLREEYESKYKDTHQKIEALINEIAIKDIVIDFERIYNNIFGSQISLLETLQVFGSSGATILSVGEFWNTVRKNNPVFKDWDLGTYIIFLYRNKLIEQDNTTIKITDYGIAFLTYITNRKYNKNKGL